MNRLISVHVYQSMRTTKQSMGNGETLVAGIAPQADGTLLAITPASSKPFKTQAGAALWLSRRGYSVDGTRRSIPAAERVYPVRRTDGAVVLCSVPGRVSL